MIVALFALGWIVLVWIVWALIYGGYRDTD